MNETKKLTQGAMLLAIIGALILIDRMSTFLFTELLGKTIVIHSLPVLDTTIPIFYNIPFLNKFKYSNITTKTSNCEEWYLYDFSEKANNETKAFFQKLISTKNMIHSL